MRASAERVSRVVCHVLRATLADAGETSLTLVGPDTPEGTLLRTWCDRERIALGEGGLRAYAANRTALLLDGIPDAEILPLGDVPASAIAAWTGAWTGSEIVRGLADAAGGIDRLDAALGLWLDARHPFEVAFADLPAPVRDGIHLRFARGRLARRRAGIVPKLGHRTIGHDLSL